MIRPNLFNYKIVIFNIVLKIKKWKQYEIASKLIVSGQIIFSYAKL